MTYLTTRRIRLPRSGSGGAASGNAGASATTGATTGADDAAEGTVVLDANAAGARNKGQEVLLTDTVGFISKLPTDLIAAFRATLEEVGQADVLIHVIDRSSPVYDKQVRKRMSIDYLPLSLPSHMVLNIPLLLNNTNNTNNNRLFITIIIQRETVLRELDAIGCRSTPVVELWNKIDGMEDPEEVRISYYILYYSILSCPIISCLCYSDGALLISLPS